MCHNIRSMFRVLGFITLLLSSIFVIVFYKKMELKKKIKIEHIQIDELPRTLEKLYFLLLIDLDVSNYSRTQLNQVQWG